MPTQNQEGRALKYKVGDRLQIVDGFFLHGFNAEEVEVVFTTTHINRPCPYRVKSVAHGLEDWVKEEWVELP